jgi:hypothetical protein
VSSLNGGCLLCVLVRDLGELYPGTSGHCRSFLYAALIIIPVTLTTGDLLEL